MEKKSYKVGDIVRVKKIWLRTKDIETGGYEKHIGQVFKIVGVMDKDDTDKYYSYRLDTEDNSGWNWRELEIANKDEYIEHAILRQL